MSFDPYHEWLGIPPGDRPPTHYQLLGVAETETDPMAIVTAAERRTLTLKRQTHPEDVEISERLQDEVYAAKVCLLSPPRRADYDARLRGEIPASPGKGSVSLDIDDGGVDDGSASGSVGSVAWQGSSGERPRTRCPKCRTRLRLKKGTAVGDRVKCRHCRHRFEWDGQVVAKGGSQARELPPAPRASLPSLPSLPALPADISEIESLPGLSQPKPVSIRPMPVAVPIPKAAIAPATPIASAPLSSPALKVAVGSFWTNERTWFIALGGLAVVLLTAIVVLLALPGKPLPDTVRRSGTTENTEDTDASTSSTSDSEPEPETSMVDEGDEPPADDPAPKLPKPASVPTPPRPATERRQEVELVPVEDLQVYPGRTAIFVTSAAEPVLSSAAPGEISEFSEDFADPDRKPPAAPPPVAQKLAQPLGTSPLGRGLRYVSVVGVVPHEKLIHAVQKATHQTNVEKAALETRCVDFEIERQSTLPGSDVWTSAWQVIELAPVIEDLLGWDGWDEDPVAVPVTDPVFTMPLPPRAMGRWDKHGVHPRMREFLLSDQQLQIEREKNEKAAATARNRPSKDQAGFAAALLDIAAVRRADEKSVPKELLFRFIDTRVEPGRTYRYRVLLRMRNPNFGLPASDVDLAAVAKGEFRKTPWSSPSPPAVVEPDSRGFLSRVPRRLGKALAGAELDVFQWIPALGTMSLGESLPVVWGQCLGGTTKTDRLDIFREVLEDKADVSLFAPEILVDSTATPLQSTGVYPDLDLTAGEITTQFESGQLDEMAVADERGELTVETKFSTHEERGFHQARYQAQMNEYQRFRKADPRRRTTLDELIKKTAPKEPKPPRPQNPANPRLVPKGEGK